MFASKTKKSPKEKELLEACQEGKPDALERLLSEGANVNAADVNKKTGLIKASTVGHKEIVKSLLNHGANVNAIDDFGKHALLCACEEGHKAIVEMLLEGGADKNLSDTRGKTGLFYACAHRYFRIMELLIKSGIDINIADKNNLTPLAIACSGGHMDVVEVLMKNGASTKSIMDSEKLTWIKASESGHEESVEFLLKQCSGDLSRHAKSTIKLAFKAACDNGHYRIVQMFANERVRLDVISDWDMCAALAKACVRGQEKLSEVLVQLGADVNGDRGQDNLPCLLEAVEKGHRRIVEMLVENGANVNHVYKGGYARRLGCTALTVACDYRFKDIGLYLIKHGADVNVRFGKRPSPFIWAFRNGDEEVIQIIRERGFAENGSAFLEVCKEGYENMVEFFITCGVDVNVPIDGKLPLIEACANVHNESAVKLLLKHGAKVNAFDKAGTTALIQACCQGNEKIVELLLLSNVGASTKENMSDRNEVVHGIIPSSVEDLSKGQQEGSCNVHNIEGCDTDENVEDSGFNLVDLQHTEHGQSAVMVAALNGKIKCLQMLMCAGANLDLSDREGKTVFSYAMNLEDTQCLRYILFKGKLLNDGEMKQVHKDAVDSSRVSLEALLLAIEVGVFKWSWCPERFCEAVFLMALKAQICPGKITHDSNLRLSPFIIFLRNNNEKLVEICLNRMYYFPEDYRMISTDNNIRKLITNLAIVDEITHHPLSLQTWSFLTVSKAISVAGPPCLRDERIDSLPVPRRLKKMLTFQVDD